MARKGVLPSVASLWASDSPEPRRLADALRQRRLSILCGEDDDARAELIVTGLLPLLRRRTSDAAMLAPREASSVILPFPERRSNARARLAELVVFNDAWDDASPAVVHRAIDDALRSAGVVPERDTRDLADRVRALGDRYGTRVLFVFDRFDVLLDQCTRRTAPNLLLDELDSLLCRQLPANALISMPSQALALLERLCERWPAMDAELFTKQASAELERPPENVHRLHAAPHEDERPGARDETYADIMTFVQRSRERGNTAVAGPSDADDPADRIAEIEPLSNRTKPQLPSAEVVALANALTSMLPPRAQPAAIAYAPSRPLAPTREMHRTWALATAAVLVLTGLFVGLHAWQDAGGPTPMTEALRADGPVAPPASNALPPLEIAIESEDGKLPVLATELVNAVSNTAVRTAQVATVWPATSSAAVAIVRYDTLQATALRGGSMPISVIAPLYTEELYVVARADSPLRHIHQLRGRRINIGPADGARALTVLALYKRMFGRPLPQARRDTLDAATALQRLAAHPTFDAVVLVQPEPSNLWASLTPETRRALRLLSLDPRHPASRRALQEYLPATLHEPTPSSVVAPPIPTLAAMAFLVANGTPDAAHREAIVSLTRSFCGALPGLKRNGHPKWREVRAGQQIETPWMPDTAAAAAWGACTDAGPPSPSPQPQGARR